MHTFYPYDLENPVSIDSEEHRIIGGKIRLTHIPQEGSLTVRGFVEAKNAANLQSNEFFCAYRKDTLYREANRLVHFYAGRNGQTVYCSYKAVGTVVTADAMNEIKAFMENTEQNFSLQEVTNTNLGNRITNARAEAVANLERHNTDANAHTSIQNEVAALKAFSLQQGQTLQQNIDNARTEAATNLERHNVNTSAHADIRGALGNEAAARTTADANLNLRIGELETDFETEIREFENYITNLQAQINSMSSTVVLVEELVQNLGVSSLKVVDDDVFLHMLDKIFSDELTDIMGNIYSYIASQTQIQEMLDDVFGKPSGDEHSASGQEAYESDESAESAVATDEQVDSMLNNVFG